MTCLPEQFSKTILLKSDLRGIEMILKDSETN